MLTEPLVWKLALLTLLVAVSLDDAAYRRISNPLAGCALLLGTARWFAEAGLPGVAHAYLATGATLALMLLPYVRGYLGAGDVKIAAAYACIVGPGQLFAFAWWSLIAVATLSVVYLAAWHRARPEPILSRLLRPRLALVRGRLRAQTLPLAVALSLGVAHTLRGLAPWQL